MGTVLLVEDDPDIRHLASDEHRGGGFAVIEAADGAQAPEQARRWSAVPEAVR